MRPALAFLTGLATFVAVSLTLSGDSTVIAVLLGVVYLCAVVAMARSVGVAYATPTAMAGLLGFDWYAIPPTHELELPDLANSVQLLSTIGVGVLIGELAARAGSRADSSEVARRELARDQEALRRVATLVAEGAGPDEVFAAVGEEVAVLLGVEAARIIRYESDDELSELAGWVAPGLGPLRQGRAPIERTTVASEVLRTGAVARIDDYASGNERIPSDVQELGIRSSIGVPIVLDGRLWGAMLASSLGDEVLPEGAESRLAEFTQLVATAVSNTASREEIARLAREQAALRRVATLVAQGGSPPEVFAAVAREVALVLDVDVAHIGRYEDGATVGVGSWSRTDEHLPVGTRAPLDGTTVASLVFDSGRPARMSSYDPDERTVAGRLRARLGVRSSVGAPIIVEGRLWGVVIASSKLEAELPKEAEARVSAFTELVGTAISNSEARAALAASRVRIVEATDQARRRFERDLHDGAQQRLVALTLEMRAAEAMAPPGQDELRQRLAQIADGITGVLDELRDVSRGMHPAILAEGGLEPALRVLVRRSAVPTELDVNLAGRLPERVEVAAYFVISEALTNAAKHARASAAEIHVDAGNGVLDLDVRDDGVGGADPAQGSGLMGLSDRVEALGGTLSIVSPSGSGTALHVRLPVSTG